MRCLCVGPVSKIFRHLRDILEEFPPRLRPVFVRRAEHGRRVHGGETGPAQSDWTTSPRCCGHPERVAQQRLRGRAPQRHDDFGLDQPDLLLEPRVAGAHLGRVGLLVEPPLDQLLAHELEVLDRIGDVNRRPDRSPPPPAPRRRAGPRDRRTAARPGPPGRPAARRRTTRGGTCRTFTEHSLGGVQPEIAAAAPAAASRSFGQGGTRRDEVGG